MQPPTKGRIIGHPPMAAMRRAIQVMYALRVMPRRRASVSMNSATPSSSVSPARTLLPDVRIRDIVVSWQPFGVSMDWNGLGAASSSPSFSASDRVVPERVFGIEKGFIYRVAHCADAGDVGEDHAIGPSSPSISAGYRIMVFLYSVQLAFFAMVQALNRQSRITLSRLAYGNRTMSCRQYKTHE